MNASDKNLSLQKICGSVFIMIGILIIMVGLIWLFKTAAFVKKASKASGTVIKMEESTSSRGGSIYTPIFTFHDASGIIHTQHSSAGSSTYEFEPGEKVAVLYDSAAPLNSEIDSFGQVWFGPLAMTGFGILFCGFCSFGLFIYIRGARLEKKKDAA